MSSRPVMDDRADRGFTVTADSLPRWPFIGAVAGDAGRSGRLASSAVTARIAAMPAGHTKMTNALIMSSSSPDARLFPLSDECVSVRMRYFFGEVCATGGLPPAARYHAGAPPP